ETSELVYYASDALTTPPELLTAQSQAEGSTLIGGIYPIAYADFAEPQQAPTTRTPFWSSVERKEGIDYLEIDLGKVQSVNFVTFEASTKPYRVDMAYDVLDDSPARHFIPVTYADERSATSAHVIGY